MGNQHTHGTDSSPASHKSGSATPGSRQKRSETLSDAESAYYMTEAERTHLRLVYEMIYLHSNSGVPSREGLRMALHQEESELLLNTFDQWLRARNIRDYATFELAIITAARVSSGRTIEYLWEISQYCRASEEETDKTRLFLFCRITMFIISEREHTADQLAVDHAAEALEKLLLSASRRSDPTVEIERDLERLVSTVHEFTPHIAKAFHAYLSVRLLLAADNPSFKPYLSPALSVPSECATQLALNTIALHCEELQSDWKRLYSTTHDGLSFNRISHHVLGYDGPTCMIIKCSHPSGCVFGSLTTERWKEMNKFYGSSKSILFTLTPKLRILRSKIPGNSAYQWLNSKSFNMPHGMGLGGTLEGFRVFIPESLEKCTARDSGPTYENGKLITEGDEFEIDTLEIWGCGGHSRVHSALEAQRENRKIMEESRAKARKVDKAAFFDSSFDREFLLGNTFAHDKEKQERLEEY